MSKVVIRGLGGRGAHGIAVLHGQALFAPGTDVDRWRRRFTATAIAAASRRAPSNKRPRWAHYGKPLKSTMRGSTRTRLTAGGGFFYGGVGSVAHYSAYVDQGTGIFGGNGPYAAKILPPWTRGSASLYEHTWRPRGIGERLVAPVMIKGQKGQEFFDAALADTFFKMRLQRRVGGVSAMAAGNLHTPEPQFLGNTPADMGFIAQLQEWRAWRDEAWQNNEGLGRGGGIGSRAQGEFREKAAATARARAEAKASKPAKPAPKKPKVTKPKRDAATKAARDADRGKFLVHMQKKYGAGNVDVQSIRYEGGFWYVTVRTKDDLGRTIFVERRAKAKT